MDAFNQLSHASRLAIRELCEALGARVDGYCDGCFCLAMKPSDDRRGWSWHALVLNDTLQALGLERVQTGFYDLPNGPDDPYVAWNKRHVFSARYRVVRDPFPLASTVST